MTTAMERWVRDHWRWVSGKFAINEIKKRVNKGGIIFLLVFFYNIFGSALFCVLIFDLNLKFTHFDKFNLRKKYTMRVDLAYFKDEHICCAIDT